MEADQTLWESPSDGSTHGGNSYPAGKSPQKSPFADESQQGVSSNILADVCVTKWHEQGREHVKVMCVSSGFDASAHSSTTTTTAALVQ